MAGTSGSSSLAIRSRSATLAISFGATPVSSLRCLSKTFKRSTSAPIPACSPRAVSVRAEFLWRGCARATPLREARRHIWSFQTLWARRAIWPARFYGAGLHRKLAQGIIFKHPIARHIARLRSSIAPFCNLDKNSHHMRPPILKLQPFPSIFGSCS